MDMYETEARDSVLQLAAGILDINRELNELRRENEILREYKDKYNELLNQSEQHANIMSGQVLTLLLNGGKFEPDAESRN